VDAVPDAADRVVAPVEAVEATVEAAVEAAADTAAEACADVDADPGAASGARDDAGAGDDEGAFVPVDADICVATDNEAGAGAWPGLGKSASTIVVARAIPPSAKARRHFRFFVQAFDCKAKASIRPLV